MAWGSLFRAGIWSSFAFRVWVLCGDSELAEGSIWEAIDKASYYKLSNLVVMADINRLGQRGPTELQWDLDRYQRRFEAFGARALVIDGHDLSAIDGALSAAEDMEGDSPTVIIARTIKGKGFSEVENKNGWHGKPFPPDMAASAIEELGGERHLVSPWPATREGDRRAELLGGHRKRRWSFPSTQLVTRWPPARPMATRYVLWAPAIRGWSHSTARSATRPSPTNSPRQFPDRYFEMFIAEQQLVAAATGLNVRGYTTFASTFAAFFTRAFDFIRMGAISGVDLRLSGSHCGVEIGADGPSQMGLEDLAMMRSVHGSTVLYPSDATSAAALVEQMSRTKGHQLHPHHTRGVPGRLRAG